MPPALTPPTDALAGTGAEAPAQNRNSKRFNLQGYGPLIGLVLLSVIGTLLNHDFATWANWMNVLTRTALIGIIAIGMCIVIISGGIDLSVGAMAALIAGSVILMMNALAAHLGSPVLIVMLGMAFALTLGGLFGLAHGLLITKGRIEPFIVTLGTMGIFRAVLTWFSNGGELPLDNNLATVYGPVYYGVLLGVPIPVWVLGATTLAGSMLLNDTRFGRHVQAIGSNEQVARYAAVDVNRVKVLTYVLLGVCVGLATLLYVPQLGAASPTTGLFWEMEAIAAVMVGGTAFKGGEGTIVGAVIGAMLLSVIGNILNLTSIISVYLNSAVQGLVIICVAFLQRRRR